MISLYGKNMKKVLTWKKITQTQEYVEIFKNQAEMIEKFAEYVNSYDPDILTGYFSDGFEHKPWLLDFDEFIGSFLVIAENYQIDYQPNEKDKRNFLNSYFLTNKTQQILVKNHIFIR